MASNNNSVHSSFYTMQTHANRATLISTKTVPFQYKHDTGKNTTMTKCYLACLIDDTAGDSGDDYDADIKCEPAANTNVFGHHSRVLPMRRCHGSHGVCSRLRRGENCHRLQNM